MIFVCIALLLPFVLEFCLPVFCFFVFVFSIVFYCCYNWWICFWFGCSLLSFSFFKYVLIFQISNNFFIFYFNNYFILCFLSFSLPFLLSRMADRVLVLRPGVRPVTLRWESRVQDIGPPETSRLHVISNGKGSPRDLYLNAKTQLHSMTSKLQGWTPYAKQLGRQEHNPTH